MRQTFLLVVLALLACPAMGQDPRYPGDEAEEAAAIRELRAEMDAVKAFRIEHAQSQFESRMMDVHGLSQADAKDFTTRVAEVFAMVGKPIVIHPLPYGAPDFEGMDRDTALMLMSGIQDVHRFGLRTKARWMLDSSLDDQNVSSSTLPLKRPCRSCIAGIEDCISLIDALYWGCIDAGVPLVECQEIWLDTFHVCEDLMQACEDEDAC